MTGLHVGLAIALATLALMSILLGADFELLTARQGSAAWWFIVIWLATSLVIAVLPNTLIMWRVGLFLSAATLIATAIAGILVAARLGWMLAIALFLLAALLLFAATRLKARQRNVATPTIGKTICSSSINWPRRLSWWVLSICMLEAFRMSYTGAGDVIKAIGCAGMLIAFFLMLPALSLSTWYPRFSAATWILSALSFATLAWLSASLVIWSAAALCMLCAMLMLRLNPHDPGVGETAQ